jgi:DNA-binding XRE family transcriptional regulator
MGLRLNGKEAMAVDGSTTSDRTQFTVGQRAGRIDTTSSLDRTPGRAMASGPDRGMRPWALRQIRAERRLSRRDLARAAGVATNTIYSTEIGRTLPRFAAIRKIARALGVNPVEIAELRRAIEVRAQPRPPVRARQSG